MCCRAAGSAWRGRWSPACNTRMRSRLHTEASIVHRDLKPGNIMIASSGLVKVLDFGIAKRVSAATTEGHRPQAAAALTIVGEAIGTPAYMSPEQTLGDAVDARSDLFSFGVVLYEMLAGQLPFQSTTNLSLVRQMVAGAEPQRPLRTSAPHVPSGLVALVDAVSSRIRRGALPVPQYCVTTCADAPRNSHPTTPTHPKRRPYVDTPGCASPLDFGARRGDRGRHPADHHPGVGSRSVHHPMAA